MSVLFLSLLASLALANPPADTSLQTAPDTAVQSEQDTVADQAQADKTKLAETNDRNCLRHTGTRIARRDKDGCINAAGRSYDRRDIDSTGAMTTAEALERLDPSVSIRR